MRDVLLSADNLSLAGLWTGISFAVTGGSALLITGENGAGKTSLIRILCGLGLADSGAVRWRGDDIADNSEDYHAEILYVGHRDGLKDDLTPLENLNFAAALHKSPPRLPPGQALQHFGAPPNQLCGELSAGQRRRTALSRLLITRAALWLLDEPFTALDDKGRRALGDAVGEHLSNGGALIMSSHQAPDWNIDAETLHLPRNNSRNQQAEAAS